MLKTTQNEVVRYIFPHAAFILPPSNPFGFLAYKIIALYWRRFVRAFRPILGKRQFTRIAF